jgi:hypothetical protein
MSSYLSACLRRTAPANTLCLPLALTRSGRRLHRRLQPVAARRLRLLLLGACHGERAGLAPGGLDLAGGALNLRNAELVGVAVEGIGGAAHVLSDAE